MMAHCRARRSSARDASRHSLCRKCRRLLRLLCPLLSRWSKSLRQRQACRRFRPRQNRLVAGSSVPSRYPRQKKRPIRLYIVVGIVQVVLLCVVGGLVLQRLYGTSESQKPEVAESQRERGSEAVARVEEPEEAPLTPFETIFGTDAEREAAQEKLRREFAERDAVVRAESAQRQEEREKKSAQEEAERKKEQEEREAERKKEQEERLANLREQQETDRAEAVRERRLQIRLEGLIRIGHVTDELAFLVLLDRRCPASATAAWEKENDKMIS